MINWFNSLDNINNSKVLLTNDYDKTNKLLLNIQTNNCLFIIFGNNLKNINNILANNDLEYVYTSKNFKKKLNKLNKTKISNIFIIFDLNTLNYNSYNLNNIAKNIKYIKNICIKNNISFGIESKNNILLSNIIIPNSFNYLNNKDMNIVNDIANLNICFNFENKKELYEYIYDTVCDYLDNEFKKKHYCDFCNDKCIANRQHKTCHNDYGCCYYIKYQGFGNFKNMGLCKYQKNKQCEINCLPCKLFTCKFYKKQGIKYEPNDIFLLKYFFNKNQKLILKYNIYMDKKKIINKLLEKNNLPSFIYYIFGLYYIKD